MLTACIIFYSNKYTLGVFIDSSKTFDADHNILTDKLSLYGLKNNSLKWFSNRKQFI